MPLRQRVVAAAILLGAAAAGLPAAPARCTPAGDLPPAADPITIHVFHDHDIHFDPQAPGRFDSREVRATDAGRVISRTLGIPVPPHPFRIIARVSTRPIPKDDEQVHDKWDRAANVRLARPGEPDIEILKFITAYGGPSEHRAEVTHLAPLLRGEVTLRGFIDTWSSPGWKMDFSLTLEPAPGSSATPLPPASIWAAGVLYEEAATAEKLGDQGLEAEVEIPPALGEIVLYYFASGHATDGRGGDEFETREHVITIDGREVARIEPWRTDCRRFREVNPYCRRWSDGSWSSDYSRSGWCPGDFVPASIIDVSVRLSPGRHRIGFQVPGIRPRDAGGNHGYWRLSAHLAAMPPPAAPARQ